MPDREVYRYVILIMTVMAKMSAVLEDHLRTAKPDDWIDIVLEVAESSPAPSLPSDRRERSAAADEQFTSSNQEVIQQIEDAGGEVLGKSWLSSAIKARVRVNDIDRLLTLDHVERIDLPRQITRGS